MTRGGIFRAWVYAGDQSGQTGSGRTGGGYYFLCAGRRVCDKKRNIDGGSLCDWRGSTSDAMGIVDKMIHICMGKNESVSDQGGKKASGDAGLSESGVWG